MSPPRFSQSPLRTPAKTIVANSDASAAEFATMVFAGVRSGDWENRGGDIADERVFAVGPRGRNFGGGSVETEGAAFHAEGQACHSSFHGGRAEPVGFVRLQTGVGEAGRKTASAVGDRWTAIRVHST